ncbi:hypothetical protein ACWOEJ_09940 [Enterococcus eurekensis]|uniref:Uncharacterized protein n=1 Tax=Enterococcus eurekensis TaxID=1159753 RepID=A0ABV9M462_9ENTE
MLISMYPKDEVPYAESYLKVINNEKKNYRIIYWNRSETKDNKFLDKEIYFNLRCPNGGSKIKKIFKIFSYARFIRKELKKPIYDKVVVLTTVPGILLWIGYT